MRRSFILVGTVAMLGCGDFWTSNSVNLDPLEDAPVRVSDVRMRHSRAIGLTAGPARMSSGDPPNAVGVQLSVQKVGSTPPHAGVGARLSCRVGDFVVVGSLAHDASNRLASLSTGASITVDETFLPNAFTTTIPSVCETNIVYMVRPPLQVQPVGSPEPEPEAPGPEANDLVLGSTCLADGVLRTGPCTRDELPRTPAASPLAISEVQAEIAPHREGGFGVRASVLITTGSEVPKRWSVGGRVRCGADDAEAGRSLSMVALGRGLAPGESVVDQGSTSPQQPWSERPTACTLAFESRTGDERTSLGEFCLRDDATTAGAYA